MNVEVMTGVLSCLVHEGSKKNDLEPEKALEEVLSESADPSLKLELQKMIVIARKISLIQQKYQIYTDSFAAKRFFYFYCSI